MYDKPMTNSIKKTEQSFGLFLFAYKHRQTNVLNCMDLTRVKTKLGYGLFLYATQYKYNVCNKVLKPQSNTKQYSCNINRNEFATFILNGKYKCEHP